MKLVKLKFIKILMQFLDLLEVLGLLLLILLMKPQIQKDTIILKMSKVVQHLLLIKIKVLKMNIIMMPLEMFYIAEKKFIIG